MYLHACINLYHRNKIDNKGAFLKTTTGRVIFNEVVPEEIDFINEDESSGI